MPAGLFDSSASRSDAPTGESGGGRSVAQKVEFLSDGANLGEPGARVERIETHFAWIFLTPRHGYKLRKPIRYHGIDTLSLAARYATCREELRVNQALAPGVYLDVVPLVALAKGGMHLGAATGDPIDWLVKMRRLPAERMLDFLVRAGKSGPADFDTLLRHLWNFYACLTPIVLSGDEYCRRLSEEIDCNRGTVETAISGIDASAAYGLASRQRELLERLRPQLARRAEDGCIRECHGDLRPEHICLGPPILIIDRLDFDRELRLLDPLEELSFLSLECQRLGLPTGLLNVQHHAPEPLDAAAPLLDFYLSNRAFTRARLAAWRLAEPDADSGILIARVRDYLQRASAAACCWSG
jgi:uncharacterized protein